MFSINSDIKVVWLLPVFKIPANLANGNDYFQRLQSMKVGLVEIEPEAAHRVISPKSYFAWNAIAL